MAERAADYLESHPEDTMVILAGSGHLAYGSGIPRRLVRRIPVSTAIVLNDWEGDLGPKIGDFLLLPERRDLPAAGRIGAFLDEDQGRLEILSCTSSSACETAGLKPGVIMWDKLPGDKITLELVRRRWLSGPRQLTLEVTLH
jgi:hypothetical protein